MIYREIVHTCSNSEVAGAAVDSIGGDFAKSLRRRGFASQDFAWRLCGQAGA